MWRSLSQLRLGEDTFHTEHHYRFNRGLITCCEDIPGVPKYVALASIQIGRNLSRIIEFPFANRNKFRDRYLVGRDSHPHERDKRRV